MNGTSNAGASSANQQSTAAVGGLRPRTSFVLFLVLALLLGGLSLLVTFPAAQHLRSLQDGERAHATLHTSGSCMLGQCQVEFEAGGRTVVADLPVGSGGGKNSAGTALTVRYQADDPQVVAREDDIDGGGAVVMTVMAGIGALLFLVIAVVSAIAMARQRRTDSLPPSGR